MVSLQDEFPLNEGLIYLNHAAVSPWPKRTAAAVKAFADENVHQGSQNYPEWMRVERELRSRLGRLINAGSDEIALLKNTSEGLSMVAAGMEWRAGDNIVSTDQEFPSNRIVWESLKSKGVELRLADISGADPEGAMLELVDKRTKLIAVSAVQYATGLRMDLQRLGSFCREHDVFFCVDAIQSLGALKFDVQSIFADAITADAHKWMLGPEGIALFYVSPAWREKLKLTQFGWHMVERAGDFDAVEWLPAKSARRFEPGSPNMLGVYALNASLSLFEEIGMDVVEREVLSRSQKLIDLVDVNEQLELVTAREKKRHAGIVTFRVRALDSAGHANLYRELMQQGVMCANRAGGIRFSPHFHTPPVQLEEGIERVLELAR